MELVLVVWLVRGVLSDREILAEGRRRLLDGLRDGDMLLVLIRQMDHASGDFQRVMCQLVELVGDFKRERERAVKVEHPVSDGMIELLRYYEFASGRITEELLDQLGDDARAVIETFGYRTLRDVKIPEVHALVSAPDFANPPLSFEKVADEEWAEYPHNPSSY